MYDINIIISLLISELEKYIIVGSIQMKIKFQSIISDIQRFTSRSVDVQMRYRIAQNKNQEPILNSSWIRYIHLNGNSLGKR